MVELFKNFLRRKPMDKVAGGSVSAEPAVSAPRPAESIPTRMTLEKAREIMGENLIGFDELDKLAQSTKKPEEYKGYDQAAKDRLIASLPSEAKLRELKAENALLIAGPARDLTFLRAYWDCIESHNLFEFKTTNFEQSYMQRGRGAFAEEVIPSKWLAIKRDPHVLSPQERSMLHAGSTVENVNQALGPQKRVANTAEFTWAIAASRIARKNFFPFTYQNSGTGRVESRYTYQVHKGRPATGSLAMLDAPRPGFEQIMLWDNNTLGLEGFAVVLDLEETK